MFWTKFTQKGKKTEKTEKANKKVNILHIENIN